MSRMALLGCGGAANVALVWSDTFAPGSPGNSTGWNGFTLRQTISAADTSTSGANIRVTLAASSAAGCSVSKVYIQEAAGAGDTYDFSTTPVQVLFSGSGSVVLGAGGTVISDTLVFAFDHTKNYVISAHFNAVSEVRSFVAGGGSQAWSKAGDDATTVNATGYSPSAANSVRLVSKIEVAP